MNVEGKEVSVASTSAVTEATVGVGVLLHMA